MGALSTKERSPGLNNPHPGPARPPGPPARGDTFGRGDVAEADLGRLVAVLVGAFPAGARPRGGRPTSGSYVLRHGDLGDVGAGSGGPMDTDSGPLQSNGLWPPPPPARTFQKASPAEEAEAEKGAFAAPGSGVT